MNDNFNVLEHVLGDDIDVVTGLYGTHTYRNEITHMIHQKKPFKVMIFGIDDFKHINNLHSYSFGNRVLKNFSDRVQDSIANPHVKLFRVDGDGFGLICTDTENDVLENQYKEILRIAQLSKKMSGFEISFTISAGICHYPHDGSTCDEIHQNAMIALSVAKNGMKKSCVNFSAKLSESHNLEMLLLDKLKWSVNNDFEGFSLVYQPIIKCDTKEIYGCEALLRWGNPAFTYNISPDIFIPVLAKCRLLFEVGYWVIQQALAQCAKWVKLMPDFKMNINVSAIQFQDSRFATLVLDEIEKHGLKPTSLVLELTESEYVDYNFISESFNFFRKHGVMMALDDFGTGYASVEIFRVVSADELKIDRSFIKDITYSRTDQIILKGIIDMCRALDIMVCVEGIENKETEDIIAQMNPHLFQGYLYSRPVPAHEIEQNYFDLNHASIPEASKQDSVRPTRAIMPSEMMNVISSGFVQVRMDEKFSMIGYNEAFRRMTGYSTEDVETIFQNEALNFIYAEDRARVLLEIEQQLKDVGTVTSSYRLLKSDGSYFWIISTARPFTGPDGVQTLIATFINIDDIKLSEIAKLEELEKYEHILGNSPVGIQCLTNDAEYTIEYMSSVVTETLGYTKEELLEKFDNKYLRIVCEEDRARIGKEVQEKIKHSDLISLRYRASCKDGSLRWIQTVNRYCKPDAQGIRRWSCSVLLEDEIITE